ncbi:hypothetical protein ACOME3_010072 [Neoechinorhynchus agilis]
MKMDTNNKLEIIAICEWPTLRDKPIQNAPDPTPPFCKLCHVRFTGPENSLVHFSLELCISHRNRLVYIKRRALSEIELGCDVCCCEVNTEEVLKIHRNSPKHRRRLAAKKQIEEIAEIFEWIVRESKECAQ